jgi:predicted AAA+ superfamily ATPase
MIMSIPRELRSDKASGGLSTTANKRLGNCSGRRRWFAGYVEQMITRDVPAVAPRRDPELLRRYLSVLAVNTAGIAAESTLWSAAGINAKTAQAYQTLFQRMFVLDLVPAWFSNRIKRLVKAPKRYLVDPALVAAVLTVVVRAVGAHHCSFGYPVATGWASTTGHTIVL